MVWLALFCKTAFVVIGTNNNQVEYLMKSKVNTYLISGVFLTYFGLKDENFVIWYNGVALILGITALIYALIEYRKTKKEE